MLFPDFQYPLPERKDACRVINLRLRVPALIVIIHTHPDVRRAGETSIRTIPIKLEWSSSVVSSFALDIGEDIGHIGVRIILLAFFKYPDQMTR
jgi:hypothetical protein